MKSIKKSFNEEPDEDTVCLYCGKKVTMGDSSRMLFRIGNTVHYAWFCKNCGKHIWEYANWKENTKPFKS